MPFIGRDIHTAARLLKEGRLVAIPTETVYGLGADASNLDALKQLYALKGRPGNHPVIVHIRSVDQLSSWASHIPPLAERLANHFWPGPITMIFRKQPHVLAQVTGGQDTVAVRIPRHELTLALLEEFEGGLAAPSANKFGRLSPTSATAVANEFGGQVSYILDGGSCDVGIESTIIDLSTDVPRILRPGMVSQEMLTAVAEDIVFSSSPTTVRAPGTLKSHYSPSTPVQLATKDQIVDLVSAMKQDSQEAAVLSFQSPNGGETHWIVAECDPEGYARSLYTNLRNLDSLNCDRIIVEKVPEDDSWSGIRDRLERASYRED
ncbi:MAG: threonylcarbamoyl-AMP synthase [Candidatus Obscuribacterales bacterium]|nr:threonylcarbamoyl-AMP synthase [Candidatus Obscuribacterales bacterium]